MCRRRALAVVAVAVVACATAACGDSQPGTLTIEVADHGPDRVSIQAPEQIEAGETEIELRNGGDMLHDAQLFRVEGRRRAADVASALESADAASKPRWLHPAGGVAATRPGETARATQILTPGVYYVADTQERVVPNGVHITNANKGGIARVETGGGETASERLPPTPATILAREYDFEATGIVAGANRVTFRNLGREAHQVTAFRIAPGKSFKAERQRILEEEGDTGWVPVDAPHERATAAVEGGGELAADMTFRAGRYLLLCFVSDRAGGSQHWRLGMESKLTVPPRPGG
jgi:hypothetical protein